MATYFPQKVHGRAGGYVKVERALLSVHDKTGVTDFARELRSRGVALFSTGGTESLLRESSVEVSSIGELTGMAEMMDGRVKTLHPGVCAGILADRDKPGHMEELSAAGFDTIDLVAVNLYPFREVALREGATLEDLIENIDIGGVTLLRAAAKNHKHVAVVCGPGQYGRVVDEMERQDGGISAGYLKELALRAFSETAAYDAIIHRALCGRLTAGDDMPERVHLYYEPLYGMRYGENPYQRASFFRDPLHRGASVAGCEVLWGKQLSYNNILDLDAALGLASEFETPAAVVIKHTNPSGVALDDELSEAFMTALAADPMSAYGGIVGLNRTCDLKTAAAMKGHFFEAIIAPDYEPDALERLKKKKNLRICSTGSPIGPGSGQGYRYTQVQGGMLVQSRDFPGLDTGTLKVVTKKAPTAEQIASMDFAVRVCRHIKSNSILLVKDRRTVGVGAGQMSRVDAAMLASHKAGDDAKGSVLASDAFFPFRDGIDEAAKGGVAAIVQPGGSIRDEEVIQAANEHGIPMVFSGLRLFKH